MSKNLTSNNIEADEINLNTEDCDYYHLITRLKEIKISILLLKKKILK